TAGHVWTTPGEWTPAPDEPVVHIAWSDAKAFCDWLSEKEGRPYALPSEAQWEFACRAGSGGLTYGAPGESLQEFAWTAESGVGKPQPVGLKRANAFGLHDMLGNVWEHCADWYGPGPTTPAMLIDPQGPPEGKTHVNVLRSGAWYRQGAPFSRC